MAWGIDGNLFDGLMFELAGWEGYQSDARLTLEAMNSECPTKIQHRISPFGNSARLAKTMFESLYSLLESEAPV